MPSPSGSLPPTEATTLANGLAHVSRSVQLGLAFSGKPSNRQVVAGAPAVDTVTRTNASTKLPPPLPTSTRKSLQLAPSKRASVAASVKETTSGSVLQTQSCDDGTVARRTSFRKRSKVWVPAPPQSAWLMAKVMAVGAMPAARAVVKSEPPSKVASPRPKPARRKLRMASPHGRVASSRTAPAAGGDGQRIYVRRGRGADSFSTLPPGIDGGPAD